MQNLAIFLGRTLIPDRGRAITPTLYHLALKENLPLSMFFGKFF
jgi:hypothetical protein